MNALETASRLVTLEGGEGAGKSTVLSALAQALRGHGGEVVAVGTADEIMKNERSITGAYLSGKKKIPVPKTRRKPTGYLTVYGAQENNLKNINLPDELVKDLLSQFIFINEVIEKSMYFKDVKGRIADILLSSNRNNNYYISLQQSIENNLNNLLFVKAQNKTAGK